MYSHTLLNNFRRKNSNYIVEKPDKSSFKLSNLAQPIMYRQVSCA